MTKSGRRKFLNGAGAASLAAIASGPGKALVARSAGASQGSAAASACFGWEGTFNGNGANVYFRVSNNMTLNSINIDVAFAILSIPANPGLAEVLCQAGVSRGVVPTFDNSGGHAYFVEPASWDFGTVTVHNPNEVAMTANSSFGQGLFYSVILKAWVPADGTSASASRQVLAEPSLTLNAGDYLAFHMDHGGAPVDAEMQVVLNYALI